jgi:hypothetical protein
MVWDRVLPLQELDTDAILELFSTYAERTNPEKLCREPAPSAAPSDSADPSGSPAPSGSAAPSETPSPS